MDLWQLLMEMIVLLQLQWAHPSVQYLNYKYHSVYTTTSKSDISEENVKIAIILSNPAVKSIGFSRRGL